MFALFLIPLIGYAVLASQPGMAGGMGGADQMNQMPQQSGNMMDNSNQQNGSSQSQQQQSSLQQMIQQVLNNLQTKLSQQQQQQGQQQQTLTSQQMQPQYQMQQSTPTMQTSQSQQNMMAPTVAQMGTSSVQNGNGGDQQVISNMINDLQGFMQKLSSTGTASTGSVATVTQTVRIPLRTFGDNVVDYIRSHSNELTGELGNFLKRIIAKHDSKIQKLKGMICEAPKDNNDWGELDVQMTNTTTTMISNVQQQQATHSNLAMEPRRTTAIFPTQNNSQVCQASNNNNLIRSNKLKVRLFGNSRTNK